MGKCRCGFKLEAQELVQTNSPKNLVCQNLSMLCLDCLELTRVEELLGSIKDVAKELHLNPSPASLQPVYSLMLDSSLTIFDNF
jgi:hypothetical protein